MADGLVDVRAYAELNEFLPAAWRGATVARPFRPHQTVKDVLEAMGIPHTEVDLVVVNGTPVDWSWRPSPGDRIAAYPVFESLDISPISQLRDRPLREPRFVVDVNLGRLAQLLRLLGLDSTWKHDLDDATIVAIAARERRVVLTRDRGLLKRRSVTHGLFVHHDEPVSQAIEVVRRLDLAGRIEPFTRCMRCNGVLRPKRKDEVLDRLEPRTRRHYEEFHACDDCGRVYWRGSHHASLAALVAEIRSGAAGRTDLAAETDR
jgi:uncharacterized protein